MSNSYIKQGDCLELMKEIPDSSVDMILSDLPYGTTILSWDKIIDFDKLWLEYERIIKKNGSIVLFGSQPFTSKLICSNLKYFKYCWVWVKDKTKCTNFVHAKNSPLRQTEDICVFSKGSIAHKNNVNRMNYNPQGLVPYGKVVKGNNKDGTSGKESSGLSRPSHKEKYVREFTNYPTNVLSFPSDFKKQLHPTQKPEKLCEYLIKTYTNEGDLVLDNCMGSGTTCVAAIKTNRNYIGIEKDESIFEVAKHRIEQTKEDLGL